MWAHRDVRIVSACAVAWLVLYTCAVALVRQDGGFALKVLQGLLSRDVFIRKPMAPRLDRCIRVSVGLDHELDIFAEELPGALATARGN